MPRTVFVLLPAYNEVPSLTQLIPEIATVLNAAKESFQILVINDGSRDATSELVRSFPPAMAVRELKHATNQGYGAALRTGYEWVIQQGHESDVAVSLDADRTHPPQTIPALLVQIDAGADGVTASYELPGGRAYGVPLLRRWMSRSVNTLFRLGFSVPGVTTYTNGFRAYRWSALKRVYDLYGSPMVEECGFPGGTELFLKICGTSKSLAEVPFELHYERRGADSKIRIGQTIRRYLALLQRAKTWKHR